MAREALQLQHDDSMTPQPTTPIEERVITRTELREILGGVCSETLRTWRKQEKIPPPDIHLSQRSQGWKVSTLRAAGINVL